MPLLGYLLNSKIVFILKIPRQEEIRLLSALISFLQFSVYTEQLLLIWQLYPLRLKCAS